MLQVDAERSVALNLIVYWCNAIYRARHESLSADLAKFNVSEARALDDADFPYFRLRSGANEGALATGWQRQVEGCVQILEREHLVAVVGAPGSGRSSLVATGLVPALRAGQLRGAMPERVWVLPTGQRDPFLALATTLAPAFSHLNAAALAQRWRAQPDTFAHDLRKSVPGSVVVIDQFEEIVGRCDAAVRESFAQALTTLLEPAPGNDALFLVLVLRSDALNDLAEFPTIQRRCLDAEFFVAFDTVELRQAIEEPAKRVGLFFEPGLVNRILRDVQGDPAALTLLGFTLEQLWKLRGGNRNLMTWAAYGEVGSCRRALDAAAERALKELPGREDVARDIFLHLVRPNWGDRFVAEAAPRAKLEALHADAGTVIDAFVAAGLLREEAGNVGIAHEALITHWRKLSRWIDQKRLALQDRLALTEASGQWLAHQRDASMLWRGTKLAEAEEYPDLSPIEHDFLRAGRRAQNRSRLRRRVALAVIAALLATAVGLYVRKQQAEKELERRAAVEKLVATRLEMSSTLNEKGLALLASGDPAGGALWFAAGLHMKVEALSELGRLTGKPAAPVADSDYRRIGCALRQLPNLSRFVALPRLIASGWSPDGTRAVLVSRRDGEIPGAARLWLLESGRVVPLDRGAFEGVTVTRAAFDATGQFLATASGEPGANRGAIHIWDAYTGVLVGAPIELAEAVVDVAFHPRDSRRVLAATAFDQGNKGSALIFDRETRAELSRLAQDLPLNRAIFNHDGSRVATSAAQPGGPRGEANIWDWEQKLALPLKHIAPVNWVDFSNHGRWVVTASGAAADDRGEAQVWDVASGETIGLPMAHDAAVVSAEFSPDDTRVLTAAGKDGAARVWDLRNPRATATLRHAGYVFCASWSPDGRSVVTGSRDQMARVWDAATGRLLLAPLNHGATVTGAHFSPDGRHLLAITLGNARLWNLAASGPASPPLRATGTVTHAALSRDGLWLAVAVKDDFLGTSEVRITHTATGMLRGKPITFDGPIAQVAFSSDGRWIATAAANRPTRAGANRQTGAARVWDAATGEPRTPLLHHDGPVTFVVFNEQDGRRLLTVSKAGAQPHRVQIWDATSGATLGNRPVTEFPVTCASLSPDGEFVACGGGMLQPKSGTALVWKIGADPQSAVTVKHDEIINSLAFDPASQRLATGSTDDAVKLWDARTGSQLQRVLHTADVTSVAFNGDGSRVVSTSFDSTAVVWNVDTGQRLATCRHGACVRRAAFSKDGRFLVTASDDRTARVWEAGNGEPIAIFSQIAEVADAGFTDDESASRVFAWSYYWPTPLLEAPTPATFTAVRSAAARSPTAARPDLALDAPKRRVDLRLWGFAPETRALDELERETKRLAARHLTEGDQRTQRQIAALAFDEIAQLEAGALPPLDLGTASRTRFHDDEATRCEYAEAWRAAAWHSEQLLKLLPSPTRDALVRDARIHVRLREDWPRVLDKSSTALAQTPADVEALLLRAEARVETAQRVGRDAPDWALAIADLETALKTAPHLTQPWSKLAEIHVARRDWTKAEAALAEMRAIELKDLETKGPRSPAWQRLAAVRLAGARVATDDATRAAWEARYRETCAEAVKLFGGIEDFGAMVAWPGLLAPDSGLPVARLLALAERAVALEPTNFYRVNTLGAALYRAGQYEEALRRLDDSRKFYALAHSATLARSADAIGETPDGSGRDGRPVDWIFLALTHAGAGNREVARQWLQRAVKAVEESERGAGNEALSSRRVWNLLEVRLLIEEAQRTIR